MGLYSAYEIVIESDIPLPELSPGRSGPDLVVRRSHVARVAPQSGDGRRSWAENGTVWLFCGRRGALRISGGREILVDPAPGADDRIVRNWVLGQGLGVAMFQRGLLVLHSSVVRSGSHAVAFAGASGAGKSTMALALCRDGDCLVADDHAVVAEDRAPVAVLSGFPQLKLREDALRHFELREGPVPRLHVAEEKLGWTVRKQFAPSSVPLQSIYVLAEDSDVCISRLNLADATSELVRNSFLCSLLVKPESAVRHRRRCMALALRVPVFRLARPRVLDGLPVLLHRVRDHVESLICERESNSDSRTPVPC